MPEPTLAVSMASSSLHHPLADVAPGLSGQVTVASLLARLTTAEMANSAQRQQFRRSILPLSLEALERQLQAGRAGVADLPKLRRIDPSRAIQVVTDAFVDGLILLFVDERRCMRLNEALDVKPETRVMIVRRTMLTG